ncbi:MAG: enoyl-CoA hydratase, partial [Gemmatimonadetes bacterium]|nr:enoyl-CoA hydratase [Gemmatimonadota bacterium]
MPLPSFQYILYEKKGHVAYVTLNRPEVMNALHPPLTAELSQVWAQISDDDDVWVGILTGAGDRAFCAGSDLKWRVE